VSATVSATALLSMYLHCIHPLNRPINTTRIHAHNQAIRASMASLQQLPTSNIELWARLSRAASGKRCWGLARECAEAARQGLPSALRAVGALEQMLEGAGGGKGGAAASAGGGGGGGSAGVAREEWFWVAVAEMQHGQVRWMLTEWGGWSAAYAT